MTNKTIKNPGNVVSTYTTLLKKIVRENPDAPLGVEEARDIAHFLHAKQKDKSGEAYFHHLDAVQGGVVTLGGNEDEQIAALFHDAVEDHHTTYKALTEAGVSEDALAIIEAVSKRSQEPQEDYLERIVKAGPGAMRVKVADLLHNLRHDRLEALPEYTRDRLLKKYRPALARLLMELHLLVDSEEQEALLKKKVVYKPTGSSTGYTGSGFSSSGPSKYSGYSLILGDWPLDAPAPVLEKLGQKDKVCTYLLANGEIWTVSTGEGVPLYTKSAWENDKKVTFKGVTEDQITVYLDVLAAHK